MSVLVSVGIVILAMLIMAFLQLTSGVFSLLCHYASGKYPKKRASDLEIFFILGAETIAVCLFLCCYYFSYILFFGSSRPETGIIAWIAVGVSIVLAVICLTFYYRKGVGSRLFIPRKVAHSLNKYAKSAKTRSDAFTLGALCGTYELPFTLPLYLITAVEIMEMNAEYYSSYLLTFLYILAPIVPLLIVRWTFLVHHSLAELAKARVRDKNFVRFILAFSYMTIAILIICFRIK